MILNFHKFTPILIENALTLKPIKEVIAKIENDEIEKHLFINNIANSLKENTNRWQTFLDMPHNQN